MFENTAPWTRVRFYPSWLAVFAQFAIPSLLSSLPRATAPPACLADQPSQGARGFASLPRICKLLST